MRYFELYENDASTGMYFHVTTQRRVKSIMATGIEPGHNRRWKDQRNTKIGDRKKIYLISDFSQAVRWAAHMEWEFARDKDSDKSEIVIVCVRHPPGLEADPHPQGQLSYGGSWYQSDSPVPVQDIVQVIPLTLEWKRQAVAGTLGAQPT